METDRKTERGRQRWGRQKKKDEEREKRGWQKRGGGEV